MPEKIFYLYAFDIKTFNVTQIDNDACEQFYNYNLEKAINTTDLDTAYNNLDSLYAFILGDTSSLLNINNTQLTEIRMASDTTYLSLPGTGVFLPSIISLCVAIKISLA